MVYGATAFLCPYAGDVCCDGVCCDGVSLRRRVGDSSCRLGAVYISWPGAAFFGCKSLRIDSQGLFYRNRKISTYE